MESVSQTLSSPSSNFVSKLFKIVLSIVLAIVLYFALVKLYSYLTAESMEVVESNDVVFNDPSPAEQAIGVGSTSNFEVIPTVPVVEPINEDFPGALVDGMKSSQGTEHGEIVPMDLLPNNDAAAIFAAENPAGTGNVQNVSHLVAGFNPGMDTRGGSMKNPTRDIRPEPRINKAYVGPWNNSTYEPDLYRKDVFCLQ
jgi:hypothetical protein